MHHLRHRSENGATSIENGANVAEVAHQYMHSLPRDQEEIINNMLRQWKRDFRINSPYKFNGTTREKIGY